MFILVFTLNNDKLRVITMSHTMNNDTHHCDNTVIDYITCMGTGDYIAIVQLFTPPAPVTLQARMKNNGEV